MLNETKSLIIPVINSKNVTNVGWKIFQDIKYNFPFLM